MQKRLAVYLTTCEEDSCWADQYLAEIDRLDLPFAVHFDRCSQATVGRFISHPRCLGHTRQDDPKVDYTERDKQGSFDIVAAAGFQWALQLDSDETLERQAPVKLWQTLDDYHDADCIGLRYVSLWETPQQIRVDGPFSSGYHVKLYHLQGRGWTFRQPTVNGAYINSPHYKEVKAPLVCLNWGAMTHELRIQHKSRWDRIYTRLAGKNPYGFWDYSLRYEEFPPQVAPNEYI